MLPVEPGAPQHGDKGGEKESQGDDNQNEAENLALKRSQGGSAFRGEVGDAAENGVAACLDDHTCRQPYQKATYLSPSR